MAVFLSWYTHAACEVAFYVPYRRNETSCRPSVVILGETIDALNATDCSAPALCRFRLHSPVGDTPVHASHVDSGGREHSLTIKFSSNSTMCTATAESVTSEWLNTFDDGANYCLLFTLFRHTFGNISSIAFPGSCTDYTKAQCG